MTPAVLHASLAAVSLLAAAHIVPRAWEGLRRRRITIELLVALAVAGALLLGEFWEAAAVANLFLIGRYLERRTLRRTREALARLVDLMPARAIVLRSGRAVEVAPDEVRIGETVLVRPGDRIPVDGEVIGGQAAVDESAMTGEPLPVEKTSGSNVYAGTISRDGTLRIRAAGIGAGTALAGIVRRIEEAQQQRAPVERLIDRFARWYTPGIVVVAAAALALTRDADLALTLLVIGCPGALVIATPVAVMAGLGRAAQRGILIKGGEHLEAAGSISALAIDKTGTLTEGLPRLTDVIPLEGNAEDVLRWVAAAETGSAHPMAGPIVAAATKTGPLPTAEWSRWHPGRGIEAAVEGRRIIVGTPELMRESGAFVPPAALAELGRLSGEGKTAALAASGGRVVAVLAVADAQRDSAVALVPRANSAGIGRVAMLTGDDPRAAAAVAGRLGIREVYARLLPAQKLDVIRRMQREGAVVGMVGDGTNDGPALAAADIGISMGERGTALAIETSGIVLLTNDLLGVADAVRISRATLRRIRENLAIAMLTVVGLLAGVLAGSVHMAGGMLIHELSVLVVILNATRLLRA